MSSKSLIIKTVLFLFYISVFILILICAGQAAYEGDIARTIFRCFCAGVTLFCLKWVIDYEN